jgi:hypothetical protein
VRPGITVAGAAGTLAVHRESGRPGRLGAEQVGKPARTGAVEDPADGRRAGRDADGELAVTCGLQFNSKRPDPSEQ